MLRPRASAACGALVVGTLALSGHAEPAAQSPTGASASSSDITVATWHDGQPPPPGYHVVSGPQKWMIAAGAGSFAFAYLWGAASVLSSQNRVKGTRWILVPGFGPWIAAIVMPKQCQGDNDTTDCSADRVWRASLVLDGIVQSAGIALIIVGATTKKQRLVRDSVSLSFGPLRVGTGHGLGFSGQF